VQKDRKLATQVASSNFRRFRAYLMAFERIISPKFHYSCEKSPGSKRIRKRKFQMSQKILYSHTHLSFCANETKFGSGGTYRVTLPSCFMFLCLTVSRRSYLNTCFLPSLGEWDRRIWSRGHNLKPFY